MAHELRAPALVVLAAGNARRYGGCKPLAPIGPNGEAVIDLLGSDALAAGFEHIVLVLHPETGPAVRYHVEKCWPSSVSVDFAEQHIPLGTVHAVLAARKAVGDDATFAVSNADDVYGEAPMGMLARSLQTKKTEHVLVGFQLSATVATDDPVTRGICEVDGRGYLSALTERRQVTRTKDGAGFRSDDGREPQILDGTLPASVNLWGFRPEIWSVFEQAMAASHLDEDALLADVARGGAVPSGEVLLPEVVAATVEHGDGLPVRVLVTDSALMGVTHAADLPVVSAKLDRQIALGIRPSSLWEHQPHR